MGIRYKKDGAYHYDGGNPPVEPTQPEVDWKNATPLDIRVADNIEDWKADNPQALVDTGYPFPKMAKEVPMSKEMTERLWELMAENTELSQQLYMAKHRLEQIKRLLEE